MNPIESKLVNQHEGIQCNRCANHCMHSKFIKHSIDKNRCYNNKIAIDYECDV